MGYHERDRVISRNEDRALDRYLGELDRDNLCCVPLCGRTATVEYKEEAYCEGCYEDELDREAMEDLD